MDVHRYYPKLYLAEVSRSISSPEDWRNTPGLEDLSSPGFYSASFDFQDTGDEKRYFLTFERVCDRADITLNGTPLPPLLVMPWQIEITGLIRQGKNDLRIKVTPTLCNQLVAYAKQGKNGYKQYKRQTTMPAGLIGKVQICTFRNPNL